MTVLNLVPRPKDPIAPESRPWTPAATLGANLQGASEDAHFERARPPRVLVVDDDEGFRTSMAAWLRRRGIVADQANGAKQALLAWRNVAYDVLILELCMPEASGNEVARRITEMDPLATIVFITGGADPGDANQSYRYSDGGFMSKPLDLPEFKLKLDRLIAHNRNRRDAAEDDRRWHNNRPLMTRLRSQLHRRMKSLLLLMKLL